MLFMQTSFIGSFMLAPLMVMRLFDYSVSLTSVLLMTRPLGFAIGAWVAGRHHATRSMRKFQIYGNGLLIIGSVFMVLGPVGRSLLLIEVGLIVTGFSNGYSRTVLSSLVLQAVDDTDVGIATGVLNMTNQLGSAIGTTVLAAIIADSVAPSVMGWAFGAALAVAFLTVPATALYRPAPTDGRP
jgi:predicted MFS family arabinose efflux permease